MQLAMGEASGERQGHRAGMHPGAASRRNVRLGLGQRRDPCMSKHGSQATQARRAPLPVLRRFKAPSLPRAPQAAPRGGSRRAPPQVTGALVPGPLRRFSGARPRRKKTCPPSSSPSLHWRIPEPCGRAEAGTAADRHSARTCDSPGAQAAPATPCFKVDPRRRGSATALTLSCSPRVSMHLML